jgi:hypothetical protein
MLTAYWEFDPGDWEGLSGSLDEVGRDVRDAVQRSSDVGGEGAVGRTSRPAGRLC